MRFTRSVLVAVLSWLTVVAVGSTMVWAVISHAGEGLVTTSEATPRSSQSSPAIPGATFLPSPSNRPTVPATEPPSSPASPSTQSSPSSPSTPDGPSSPSSPSTPDVPQSRSAIWQGVGGTVVAECTGSSINLVSASPDAGFRAVVSNPGPQELEVEFEGREDEAGRHAQVRATCGGGVPRFTSQVEVEGSED